MHFVLNRASERSRLQLHDITAAIGNHAIQQIPTVGHELIDSINDGRPLVLDQPRSAFSKAIQTLATDVRTGFKQRTGQSAAAF